MVEDAVSKFTWMLSRDGEVQYVNGAILAVLVSVALESGWKFPSDVQPASNLIDLNLLLSLPSHFDDQQARRFSRESLRALGKHGHESLGSEGAAFSDLLDFMYRGPFDLRKIEPEQPEVTRRQNCLVLNVPDDLPTPESRMRVMSLAGEGIITVKVSDSVLDYWANLERADPNFYMHAIIPNEETRKEVILIKKQAWEKASQVLRYFADSSDEVYEDQFKKVIDQVIRTEEFIKITLDD